jgi:undecaprenyl diphosphate synthase
MSAMSAISESRTVPSHVAIIMDGNGRWAKRRGEARTAGHHAGLKAVRDTVAACLKTGVAHLTLFAFSSENWKRPPAEVSTLMSLFMRALQKEVDELDREGVAVRFVGNLLGFSTSLREGMQAAEARTRTNHKLKLHIAVNYGGRWDLTQAARAMAREVSVGALKVDQIDEAMVSDHLAFAGVPDPDLFIRTGGEKRISNFLLWQMAYTELVFSDVLWPDFGEAEFAAAVASFATRERRFGQISEQLDSAVVAAGNARKPGEEASTAC